MDQLQIQFSEMKKIEDIDRSKIEQWRSIGASVGRSDIVEEIKNAYVVSGLPLIEEIRQYAATGEKENLKKCFHKMKSGCGNVGFTRLQRMCEYSEEFMKSESETSLQKLQFICVTIDEEFKKTLEILRSL